MVDALNTVIRDCHISKTHGLSPDAGIDLEENKNTRVENTLIANCIFEDNIEQAGVLVAKASNSTIKSCTFNRNDGGINLDFSVTGTSRILIKSVDVENDILNCPNHGLLPNDLVMVRKLKPTEHKIVINDRFTYRVLNVIDKDHITLDMNYGVRRADILTASSDFSIRKYEMSELSGVTIDQCVFNNNKSSIYAEQAQHVTVSDCQIN